MRSILKLSLVAIGLATVSSVALADRTISFVPSSSSAGVSISSPGAAPASLSYTLTCKDSAGAVVLSDASSIAAGITKKYPFTPCAYTTTTTYSGGMARCSGSVTNMLPYATAQTYCSAGASICTPAQYSAKLGGAWSGTSQPWLSYSYDFGTTVTWPGGWNGPVDHLTYQPVATSGSWAGCADDNTGTNPIQYCQSQMMSAPSSFVDSVMCCGSGLIPTSTVAMCSMTVTGDAGYLIIPEFKGGSPF